MKLDYGTLLSYSPIKLSMGEIRKPTLQDISDITFIKFSFYEFIAKLTPKRYYYTFYEDAGKEMWNNMSDDEKADISMYKILLQDGNIRTSYLEMLNFFFVDNVYFTDGVFVVSPCTADEYESVTGITALQKEMVTGFITEQYFSQVISVIQQICCVADDDDADTSNIKFKNEKARRLWEKIHKNQQEDWEYGNGKGDKNLSVPNLISAVASRHSSLNLCNIWGLTLFQLIDTFNRLRMNERYDIAAKSVATWGDSKNKFDETIWFKNTHDT